MKKIIMGAVLALATVFIYKSCIDTAERGSALQESSTLIQQQIENVSKLIVTEGHFAEVYNYADSKELFGPLLTADKKALVVVNAEITIVYDLQQVDFEIDEAQKTLFVKRIPQPEIKINPDFEYYDVTADYLNPFEAADYNAIKRNVRNSLLKKVEASSLKQNAQNRLISELVQFLVLTKSMGWKMVHDEIPVVTREDLLIDHNILVD
ncbi:DUF4230 domain-containing protein [uncultured Croceitalea sp.]|uniref:DUF4230 domain-containing protein n=1 Tax=uncultured Croceitalea sp. TaxID=1798908 RepID=UPI0033067F6B